MERNLGHIYTVSLGGQILGKTMEILKLEDRLVELSIECLWLATFLSNRGSKHSMTVVLSALPERVTGGLDPVSIIDADVQLLQYLSLFICSTTGGASLRLPLLDVTVASPVKLVFFAMTMSFLFRLWSCMHGSSSCCFLD